MRRGEVVWANYTFFFYPTHRTKSYQTPGQRFDKNEKNLRLKTHTTLSNLEG